MDVYLDTSSSLSFIDDATLRDIVTHHPTDRLLFGSDYPLFDPGDEVRLVEKRIAPLGVNVDDLLSAGTKLFAPREAKN